MRVGFIIFAMGIFGTFAGCRGNTINPEKAGYAEVRPGAHMFWLLQYSTHPDGYVNRPWIIWIQGGPGLSGTGYANYLMFGPKDIHDRNRSATWLQTASLVYVDSPVGTGFSYLENNVSYPITSEGIALDLVNFTISFLEENPEFGDMPLYIFGQSYGGKMASAFAYYLETGRGSGQVQCNLTAVAIGNGYVTPIDYLDQCYEMLYQMSYLDDTQRAQTKVYANAIRSAMTARNLTGIEEMITTLWDLEPTETSSYNVLHSEREQAMKSMYSDEMSSAIRHKMAHDFQHRHRDLLSNRTYSEFNLQILLGILFGLDGDGVYSVHHLLDDLLQNSSVQVIVYSGQYDVVCCTSGAQAWVRRLTWPGMQQYHQKPRTRLLDPTTGATEMYVKAHGQFKFYWVLKSGHVVPRDVPVTALRMLNRILYDVDN